MIVAFKALATVSLKVYPKIDAAFKNNSKFSKDGTVPKKQSSEPCKSNMSILIEKEANRAINDFVDLN